jgi:hypothetical protein
MTDPGSRQGASVPAAEVSVIVFGAAGLSRASDRAGPGHKEQHRIMTESVSPHPFDDMEAPAWLRSQPERQLTVSAAELGRQWGWNRMRTSRRLKAWERAGLIHRNAEAITVTGAVTPTAIDGAAAVTEIGGVTGVSGTERAHRSTTPVARRFHRGFGAGLCISRLFH